MTTTVEILRTVYGGDGLGRLGDGRVVFVPGAFAGESVKAEIFEEKRRFVRARLVRLETTSPDRIGTGEPPIPGMVYANLSPQAENAVKEAQLRDFFERARLEVPILKRLSLPPEVEAGHYRNKVVYHFARQRGRWVLGYRLEPAHEILEVTRDPLACPEINAKLPEIRQSVMTLLTQGASAVRRAIAQEGNVTIRFSERSGVRWWLGEPPKDLMLRETTCGQVFEVPADGFYQVNSVAGERLVRAVVELYAQGAEAAAHVLDLYCGVGVFGLCCLKRAHQDGLGRMQGAKSTFAPRLTGVESGRAAIACARRNAAAQGLEAKFFAEEVGRCVRRLQVGVHTTVIVDPPRGGLEPGVARWLALSRAPRVIYVSCDPATLIRDLREISATYAVESVQWVNLFPRTARFETIVALRKKR